MPQTTWRRTGIGGGRAPAAARGAPGVSHSHAAHRPTVTSENASSAARQPPKAAASGTASAEESVEPRLMPVV